MFGLIIYFLPAPQILRAWKSTRDFELLQKQQEEKKKDKSHLEILMPEGIKPNGKGKVGKKDAKMDVLKATKSNAEAAVR